MNYFLFQSYLLNSKEKTDAKYRNRCNRHRDKEPVQNCFIGRSHNIGYDHKWEEQTNKHTKVNNR